MRPSAALVVLGALLFVCAVVAMFVPSLAAHWWLPVPIVGAAALLDALLLLKTERLRISRTVEPQLRAGVPASVRLDVAPTRRRFRWITLFDGIPASFDVSGLPVTLRAGRRTRTPLVHVYETTSSARGRYSFEPARVERPSRLGLWVHRSRAGDRQEVRVFPNFLRLTGESYHLGGAPSAADTLYNLRRRGLGLEFHQLREYRQGDMMRTVDQKATSRFHKLIVREMQEEQDQTIVFLLDTGYRMIDRDSGVSHFDRAFESMLSLAYVALRQGDRVGVWTWGPDERWIPPTRGVAMFPRLVHRLYDLQAYPAASSPANVIEQLLSRLTRRSLIVLLTNFREEDTEGIAPLVPVLRSRHLLCTVWIREEIAEDLASRLPHNHEEALESAMAYQFLTARERTRRSWESQGIITVDTTASALRPKLLERYWDIKTRGLL